jgi:NAD(P)-dependent dehydrogenase (short-subunit alcohol dehydrogenase family)
MTLDPNTLSGRVALITGCGQLTGVGAAIARILAHAGADVAVLDLPTTQSGLDTLVGEINGYGSQKAIAVTADLTDETSCAKAVQTCAEALGGLNILINNAAAAKGADRGDLSGIDADAWDFVMNVNLKGIFYMVKYALPEIRKTDYGRIVNIASLAAFRSFPGRAVYGVSKAGVVGLTTSLAGDLAPEAITVNAVAPGLVVTPRNPSRGLRGAVGTPNSPQQGDAYSTAPLDGRIAMPEDIASAAAFFASDLGQYVTGQTLLVDGGLGTVMRLG